MFREHPFFSQKNTGTAKKLRGQIFCQMVFLQDSANRWTQAEKEAFTDTFRSAMQLAKTEAEKLKVPLQFTVRAEDFESTDAFDYIADRTTIDMQYARQKGAGMPGIYMNRLKLQQNADEVVLAFVQKPEITPRAYLALTGEYCAFCQSNDTRAVLHEVLHLFGAVDYYSPYHVAEAAYHYLGENVMLSDSVRIDPLTKHLVGWTDQLTEEAIAFLKEIQSETGGKQSPGREIQKETPTPQKKRGAQFTSLADLQQAAAGKDPWAQFLLGHCYEKGILTARNLRLAEENYRTCSTYDNILACYALAERMLSAQQPTAQAYRSALQILKNIHSEHIWAAALYAACTYRQQENMPDALNMTIRNYDRYTVFQNAGASKPTKVVQLYQTAEKLSAGIPQLQKSLQALREQYEKTQRDGDPVLLYLMGRFLEEGVHLRQNTKRALELYQKAAASGMSAACAAVEECYFNGIGTQKDYYEAAAWHRKAQQAKLREESDPDLSLRIRLLNGI